MDFSSALALCAIMVASLTVTTAAPSSWDRHEPVFEGVDGKMQLSPPKRRRWCECFTILNTETNENEWFCSEGSDPICSQLPIGGLEIVQAKALAHKGEAQQQTAHECVCYLSVSEQKTDFSCSNPSCYRRFVERKETANTNSWANHECIATDRHPDDPNCCRCIDNKWNCREKMYCMQSSVLQSCPSNRIFYPAGSCCPACRAPSAQQNSLPAISSNDDIESIFENLANNPCCEYCRRFNRHTGTYEVQYTRYDHECQCDLFSTYPYNELPLCTSTTSEVKKFADKLAREMDTNFYNQED